MQKKVKKGIVSWFKYLFIYLPLFLFVSSVVTVLAFKWIPVFSTPLMIYRSIQYAGDENFRTQKRWRSLEKISPHMQMAVMASEDTRFLDHKGFDWIEIDKALDAGKRGRRLRGASTISQQTAKNLFLLPARSWVRKGLEAYFTICIELIWGKERILEVYLNIAEMGKGIYGAEAAAAVFFGKTAQNLTSRESALIAATLPNPLKRRADKPSAYLSSRASDIQRLMGMVEVPEWLSSSKTDKKKTKTR
ncbi:MAG: monofunctional biosynthetic peptidoglycan transglycosylase [Bacteroidales bacterium]|nr:monofunctional biosynthetic peptidoglycan transglycosylase [Bacteroidales bacterium]MDD2424662.1 monofunctional biosynthetic peptidoglycan transglycosylase [Bacteroidales bacterium]MDD3989118.1 monofunctional biosynthetic peptidoglycan transglycosylase [Bacteroidales bacterium]MDD4638939.1 monofunctional biosynthetic peptidoglycan transglycosylase [Bacteroidales bacterium]